MRHLTTIDFLNFCILLAKLSWTTKRVIVKKVKTTISQYEKWSLENTKCFWASWFITIYLYSNCLTSTLLYTP
jgi:hypothetical protein